MKTDITKAQKQYLSRLFHTGKSDGCARMRDKLHNLGYLRYSKPNEYGVKKEELTPIGRLRGAH